MQLFEYFTKIVIGSYFGNGSTKRNELMIVYRCIYIIAAAKQITKPVFSTFDVRKQTKEQIKIN